MTLQDSLNRIEVLLRGLKDTDPAAQQVWYAVTMPCPMGKVTPYGHQEVCPVCAHTGRVSRDITDWPEGAMRGLLLLHVASDLSLWRPSVVCAEFYTAAAEIAAALIAALEARTK